MRYISATEAKQAFGTALDAAQREPVVIRKQNRDVAVLLSADEYEKLRGLRIAAFDALCDRIAAKAKARGLDDGAYADLMRDVE
ncbi:MAG: type II toxin-antitoxin system Phd/YefM family antitoxin [Tagaea sp.]|nr:type II toxin-antitoxin system Phd/YefM family antitoxin [Tagaea sp.]